MCLSEYFLFVFIMASNDIRRYCTVVSKGLDDDVDLIGSLLCGGDASLVTELESSGFSDDSPRSVIAASVSDTVEDSACRKMEKMERYYLRFHEEFWKFGIPIPSVPSDLRYGCRGPFCTSNYWFDDEDWTAVEKDSHIEIFASDSCLPFNVAMVFGQTAGQECTAVLSAISEYRRYFREMELASLKNYLLNGFEMAYKNGNFYCVDDDDDSKVMSVGVTYNWFCSQYHKLMGVEWTWPIKWDDT